MHKAMKDYRTMTKAELIAELQWRDAYQRIRHEHSKRRLKLLEQEIEISDQIVDRAMSNLLGPRARHG